MDEIPTGNNIWHISVDHIDRSFDELLQELIDDHGFECLGLDLSTSDVVHKAEPGTRTLGQVIKNALIPKKGKAIVSRVSGRKETWYINFQAGIDNWKQVA